MNNRIALIGTCVGIILLAGGALVGLYLQEQDATGRVELVPNAVVLAVASTPTIAVAAPEPTLALQLEYPRWEIAPYSQRDDVAGLDYAGRACEIFREAETAAESYWYIPTAVEVFGPQATAGSRVFVDGVGELIHVSDFYWIKDRSGTFLWVTNCPWLFQTEYGGGGTWTTAAALNYPGLRLVLEE